MALLTAQDVVDKKFQSVKFREGYDIEEVDEYLDEVVNTIYNLQLENTELKKELEDTKRRLAEARSAGSYEAVVVETVEAEPAAANEAQSAAAMLSMAQRLHDEYVNDGKAEGERLISEARQESQSIISRANAERHTILRDLDGERAALEGKIDELREYESDYRAKLRDNLNRLLSELQSDQ